MTRNKNSAAVQLGRKGGKASAANSQLNSVNRKRERQRKLVGDAKSPH
jgi:hypothetical protein